MAETLPGATPLSEPADSKAAKTETKPAASVLTDPYAETSVIQLKFPITIGGKAVSELTMRRPKVKDRLNIARSGLATEMEMETLLIGNLCGVAPQEMEAMDMMDHNALQATLYAFQNPTRLTT